MLFLISIFQYVNVNVDIFANSRWRTAAILIIALSPYLSSELSDLDQISYKDTNFHSEHANLTKSRNFSNSRWRTNAILNLKNFDFLLN